MQERSTANKFFKDIIALFTPWSYINYYKE